MKVLTFQIRHFLLISHFLFNDGEGAVLTVLWKESMPLLLCVVSLYYFSPGVDQHVGVYQYLGVAPKSWKTTFCGKFFEAGRNTQQIDYEAGRNTQQIDYEFIDIPKSSFVTW